MNDTETYKKLKEQYSDEEIADSMMIPATLSADAKAQSEAEIRNYRMEKLRQMTPEDHILSDVMRMRFQMENYIEKEAFSPDKTFGAFLAEYLRVTKRSRKDIAVELSIHYTKLSRIINNKEEANVALAYRLEKHAANLIPAKLWWKLIIKKQEFIISKDEETRMAEYEKVTNGIRA